MDCVAQTNVRAPRIIWTKDIRPMQTD